MIDRELTLAAQAPTTACNRFYVTATDARTRIAFGDVVSGVEVVYRLAVELDNADADALAELIEQLHASRAKQGPPPKRAEA